jgi:hypothetical protein
MGHQGTKLLAHLLLRVPVLALALATIRKYQTAVTQRITPSHIAV